MKHINASHGILTVGAGRGFIVEGKRQLGPHWASDRYVITAAHCLPHFPPCISFSGVAERTYRALLGPLNVTPTVWAECLFIDPISDLAVLGSPDNQELGKQADEYEDIIQRLTPIPVADASADGPAWLMSLDGQWGRCIVRH